MPLELRFQVTLEMLFRVQLALSSRLWWMRWTRIWMAVVLPLAVLTIPLAFGKSLAEAFSDNVFMILFLPIFFGVGIPLLERWSAKRLWRTTPAFQGELQYVLGSDGVRQISSVSTADTAWAGIVRAAETPDFFLLFPSGAMAHFIPKSATPTGEGRRVLRQMLREGIGDRAQLTVEGVG